MPGKKLDKTALAALVIKKNESAPEEKGAITVRLEALESSDEATALMGEFEAAEGKPSEELLAKLESLEKPVEKVEEEEETKATDESLVQLQEDFDKSQVDLASAAESIESLEAKVVKLASDLEAKAEEAKPLVAVINDQISVMRIALSLTAVDMSDWKPEAIMKEYESISDTFQKSMPVGGVVPEEDKSEKKSTQTRAEANAFNKLW
jgi:hypothetical protein